MFHLIQRITLFSAMFPLLPGLLLWKHLSMEMKYLLLYCFVASVTNLIGHYLGAHHRNNLWLAHVYTLVEYGLLATIFASWQTNPLLKNILLWSVPIFLLLGIISIFFMADLRHFNDYSRPLAGMMLVLAAAYTLFEQNLDLGRPLILKPQFWISTASLLYFGGTLVLYALSNSLLQLPRQTTKNIFLLDWIIYIIFNLLFFGGFLWPARARKYYGH